MRFIFHANTECLTVNMQVSVLKCLSKMITLSFLLTYFDLCINLGTPCILIDQTETDFMSSTNLMTWIKLMSSSVKLILHVRNFTWTFKHLSDIKLNQTEIILGVVWFFEVSFVNFASSSSSKNLKKWKVSNLKKRKLSNLKWPFTRFEMAFFKFEALEVT